ncbi:serine/threonine-protein kinase [Roseateles amylovorans]|uniref:Serine/threonine protein kinase n=1 Tax=Roseateles amylovorans TaxID=2978473 RepID=A0ABY6ASB6_9BURK|nr:serine/threonine-protein kinase [Roseateles amylovorans]UXH76126.1 serine/threonine protein kinase [Roseateles amylovorans]
MGRGGQGEVFAAWDTVLLRPVALKRLRASAEAQQNAHLVEARRSAGLRHAAFVRVHGVVSEAASHWIVMERVFGREMAEVLREGPLSVEQASSVMAQAAGALAEVHDAGVVHGDIKPANLMLQENGQLRIVDFGIAQRFDPLTTCDEALPHQQTPGTLAYLAPERLLGCPPCPASEIFTLGAVFLEAIGGRRPGADGAGPGHVAALLSGSDGWWFPPEVPAPVAQLIRAMGARDPAQRPPDLMTLSNWLSGLEAAPLRRPTSTAWQDLAPRPSVIDRLKSARMETVLLVGLMIGAVLGVIPGVMLGWIAGESPRAHVRLDDREGLPGTVGTERASLAKCVLRPGPI